jgi:hypothetical protein
MLVKIGFQESETELFPEIKSEVNALEWIGNIEVRTL